MAVPLLSDDAFWLEFVAPMRAMLVGKNQTYETFESHLKDRVRKEEVQPFLQNALAYMSIKKYARYDFGIDQWVTTVVDHPEPIMRIF